MTRPVPSSRGPRVPLHRLIGGLLVIAAGAWAVWTWTNHFGHLTLQRAAAAALMARNTRDLDRLVGGDLDVDSLLALPDLPTGGPTLLSLAVSRGDTAMTQHMLDLGADPQRRDGRGVTPLLIAAEADRVDLVEILLDGGADPDNVGRFRTALTIAALKGSTSTVELLLERGVDVNKLDPNRWTAIQAAAAPTCDLDTFLLILEAGADVDTDTAVRGTPLPALLVAAHGLSDARAREAQTEKIISLVDAGADLEARDHRNRTALIHAAQYSARAAEKLLEAGASPHVVEIYGRSVLHWAASDGDDRTVELLLEAGADPARPRHDMAGDATPLDFAKARNDEEGKKIAKRLEDAAEEEERP